MNTIKIDDRSALLSKLKPGPVALILDEDGVNLAQTLEWHMRLGFPNVLVLGGSEHGLGDDVLQVRTREGETLQSAVNALTDDLAGRWIFAAHNAEYLVFPFHDDRSVWDLVQFVQEERRDSVSCCTIDLYPSSFVRGAEQFPADDAWFDTAGYYSADRYDGPERLERQIDIFGGLKWRYAEHIPWERQKINRTALFRAANGLRLEDNGLFNEPEYNTLSCPWHHSLTAGVASFRVAKSLIQNPGSTFDIETLVWDQSEKFDWSSQQVMSHGLMEPGQWF